MKNSLRVSERAKRTRGTAPTPRRPHTARLSLPLRHGCLAGPDRLTALPCGCLIGPSVVARNGAHRPADVVIDVIIQVRERYANRPVRRGKAAAVEQDNAVVFGQPEHDVE